MSGNNSSNLPDKSSSGGGHDGNSGNEMDLSASEALARGDSAYVDEQYDEALANYAAAVAVMPSMSSTSATTATNAPATIHFRVYLHMAAALLQLARYPDALEAAQQAIGFLQQYGSSDPILMLRKGESEMAWRREGLALYELGRYSEALQSFSKAAQLAELNRGTDASVAFYKNFVDKIQCLLSSKTETKPVPDLASTISPRASYSHPSADLVPTAPKYQYYQNDKVMTIAILEPNVQESDLTVNWDTNFVAVRLRKQNQDFTVVAGTLHEAIVPDQSRINIKDEKVLIKLRKVNPGEWHELLDKKTSGSKKTATASSTSSTATATASSGPQQQQWSEEEKAKEHGTAPRPYSSRKDWNAIEKEIVASEETPAGEEAMNKLFQQIYRNADEDTRRAMIKSYQTSGGTVLSTNWKEVKEKDYEKERTAPKGMEWKTWEGDKLPMQEDD